MPRSRSMSPEPSVLRRAVLTALVALAVHGWTAPARAAGAGAPSPMSLTTPAQITADERLTWTIDYVVRNTGALGFYADSFFVDMVDEDAGETHAARRWTESLNSLLPTLPAVSGGDSAMSTYFCPARFERGTIMLRLYGHTSEGAVGPLTSTLRTEAGPVSAAYPSTQVKAGARMVELVSLPPGNAAGKAPGILLVHGEGENARRLLYTALSFHERGYGVVAVSLPGYGQSTGPQDLAGPASAAALEAAYAALRAMPGLDPQKLAVWGAGRGATSTALLAGKHPEIFAVALQSGTYDLWSAWRAASAEGRKAIEAEAGRDSSGWRMRSPVLAAPRLKCNVLLLHGELDDVAPAASAHAYAKLLESAGATLDARFQPARGHDLSILFARATVFQYFRKLFGL